jgi:AhpD family alkylhydroperoxidase
LSLSPVSSKKSAENGYIVFYYSLVVVKSKMEKSMMDGKVKLLIAVGASITANCQPCLKTAVSQAESAGVESRDIHEAIAIGRIVRRGAIGKMDRFASAVTGQNVENSDECPFGSTKEEVEEWVQQDDQCGCTQ